MTERIGITGASGFLGRNCLQSLLSEGISPVIFRGNICNIKEVIGFVRQCDTIIHLAVVNRGAPAEVAGVIYDGGMNVIEASLREGNRHVVFPSTKMITRCPDSLYSKGKLQIEEHLKRVSGVNGFSASVFRLPNVYGVGTLPHYVSVVATFCWYFGQGRESEISISGDGKQSMDFTTAERVTRLLTAPRNTLQESYSFTEVNGSMFSVNEILETIRSSSPRHYPVMHAMKSFFSKPIPIEERKHFPSSTPVGVTLEVATNKVEYLSFMSVNIPQRMLLMDGRVSVDIYGEQGYLHSSLLESGRVCCVELSPLYSYDIRSTGNVPAKLSMLPARR